MEKWADYLITGASYDENRLLRKIRRRRDTGSGLGPDETVDRLTLASDIKNKVSHVTAYDGGSSWRRGDAVRAYKLGGNYYIRTDGNRIRLDNLGEVADLA